MQNVLLFGNRSKMLNPGTDASQANSEEDHSASYSYLPYPNLKHNPQPGRIEMRPTQL